MIHEDRAVTGYGALMPYQIKDILLVASTYDSFILEEDGRFSDRLLSQYIELDLTTPPHFDHVSSAQAALKRLAKKHYDLVLTTPRCIGMTPARLAERISVKYPKIPSVLLTYDLAEIEAYRRHHDSKMAQVYLWTGDPRLLVGLVKSVEDMVNVDHDMRRGHVRVIIVVEDSPYFYSVFLPALYTEIMEQVSSLLPDTLNERDRHDRRKSRPKILLAKTYEEAKKLYLKYKHNLLGVITDLSYQRNGVTDREAGLVFARLLKKKLPDLPILVQTTNSSIRERAEAMGLYFADKNSPDLIEEIRRFMRRYFGFGAFRFTGPSGNTIAVARDMDELIDRLYQVPEEYLLYHAERNHFSNWLTARSEFTLAKKVRAMTVTDFDNPSSIRKYLIDVMEVFLEKRQRGEITEYSDGIKFLNRDFTRIGHGSMGGKARGIAFLNYLLAEHEIHNNFKDVKIIVPRTAVICTDHFDRFCARNQLRERAIASVNDQETLQMFLDQPLGSELTEVLDKLVREVSYPLAIRSSSLHEDSQLQPLAGLYSTFILPNNGSTHERFEQLSRAVRSVYASTFFERSRSYLKANSLRLEQEKMAVIIQRLIGRIYQDRFYPNFAGAAQSYNFYPVRHIVPEDGIASVALGLGHTVVEGHRSLRFSPKHPQILPQMSTPKDARQASQREFCALSLRPEPLRNPLSGEAYLQQLELDVAEKDGTLAPVGATYSNQNRVIYDTIYREGVRIVNFSGVLKHGRFPLAPLLTNLLDICSESMGAPVEIEFAANIGSKTHTAEMAILQVRPQAAISPNLNVNLEKIEKTVNVLAKGTAMGNGYIKKIRDIIYIHPKRMSFAKSHMLAKEIGRLNFNLTKQQRPYLLVGPGRWGTADSNLGIPVDWTQVAGARVIVELVIRNFNIDPSQGSHFFHNLTAHRVGYFCVSDTDPTCCFDLDYLESLPIHSESMGIRYLQLEKPITTIINGSSGRGLMHIDET